MRSGNGRRRHASTLNKLKSFDCIRFCTFLLHFGSHAHLFSPDERSCYVFSTQNNCCDFLHLMVFLLKNVVQLNNGCSIENIIT